MGKGDDDMKIGAWEHSLEPTVEPFGALEALAFGAVSVTARIIGDTHVSATFVAYVHMTAQGCSSAVFDVSHGLSLVGGCPVVLAIVRPMDAENVRNLQRCPSQARRRLRSSATCV